MFRVYRSGFRGKLHVGQAAKASGFGGVVFNSPSALNPETFELDDDVVCMSLTCYSGVRPLGGTAPPCNSQSVRLRGSSIKLFPALWCREFRVEDFIRRSNAAAW